jgi:hypothetical protein
VQKSAAAPQKPVRSRQTRPCAIQKFRGAFGTPVAHEQVRPTPGDSGRCALLAKVAMIVDLRNRYCPILTEVNELGQLVLADAVTQLPAWLERCRTAVRRFHDCLLRHVECETAGQFHRRLSDAAPQNRRRVAELTSDHERLLAECDEVSALLKACGDRQIDQAREIVRRVENVVAHFRYHAASEMELTRTAFGETPDAELRKLLYRPCTLTRDPAES